MAYSCGYWRNASGLDEAQDAKHDLICRKLRLAKNDRVLDVGCGWGGFVRYAADKYGCRVTGITISAEQFEYARRSCTGLPVDVRLCDYRDASLRKLGPFDKIVSVGMFEHVGHKNHLTYTRIMHDLLAEDGLFLLHAIGSNGPFPAGSWMEKYIFPNSELPSASDILRAIEGLFVMEDWHNFGAYYDKTLMAWYGNIERHPAARHFLDARGLFRRWRFYLLTCAGLFRMRDQLELWQIVLSKHGVQNGYVSVR
jgi:cyclopropane-fatty-acyl-phospholipid synthase